MNLKLEEAPANGRSVATGVRREVAPAGKQSFSGYYFPTEVRMLVVDDEATICHLVQDVLARPGFLIDTVSDPQQIENTLQARQYHVIIQDFNIPGIGPELIFDWLKQHQPEASVIVVTGYPSLDSVVSSLRARAYDYLTKPFDLSQLRNVVQRCLESKGLLRLSEEALRETLGLTIRERRKTLGLTLAQMADRTSVSLGYLSQIELGKNSASIETLYRICLGLGIRMADLFQAIKS